MKVFTCRDVGVDCDWETTGKDQEEILRNVEQHAREAHNMESIPDDLRRNIISNIKDAKAA